MQQTPVISSIPDARSLYTISTVNHLGPLTTSVGYQHLTTGQHSQFATDQQLQLPNCFSLPAASSHITQQFSSSCLPKLSLLTFSGDPLTWQTFWDSFCAAIHANPSLSRIQKFNYLKAQLQGDTARAIDGLPLSDMNYTHSITLLQDRFG